MKKKATPKKQPCAKCDTISRVRLEKLCGVKGETECFRVLGVDNLKDAMRVGFGE